ncbi:MAG: MIP/aquaporin family protein [Actinomycetota bacterium]
MRIRKLLAEFVGSALLVAAIVGSGVMATRLSTDKGVQLLFNAFSTVLALGVLIYIFSGMSGAHFNPLITINEIVGKRISINSGSLYLLVQFAGGICGVALANLMFDLPAINSSHNFRQGNQLLLGEIVATAGLLLIVELLRIQSKSSAVSIIVPAWIGAAYLFTSSTSFANPSVTFSRMWSDTFSGISPSSGVKFILAQLCGAIIGIALASLFTDSSTKLRERL